MNILCDSTYYTYGYNKPVILNASIPYSTLKKNSQIITYHLFCSGVARYDWMKAYVKTNENKSEPLFRFISSGENRKVLVHNLFHNIIHT